MAPAEAKIKQEAEDYNNREENDVRLISQEQCKANRAEVNGRYPTDSGCMTLACLQESVVNVIVVGMEWRLPVAQPVQYNLKGVKQRDNEYAQGSGYRGMKLC